MNNFQYDYLIVGAGLFGSVFAREMSDKGYSCLVIDKRNHIGGNCYSEEINNIIAHMYGPHIFHTSDIEVWQYINKFASFNNFSYRPKVIFNDKLYSFPINLMSLYQVFGVKTPEEARKKLEDVKIKFDNPLNFEDWILSQIGLELYNIFIKGYTQKQWGKLPSLLPSSIIKRLPIRLTYDDNYFNDTYQGIPIGGYTSIFKKLLSGIEIKLNTNYFDNTEYFNSISKRIVYTGAIDQFYNYKFGKLQYRSLNFETIYLDINDYQGNAAINYSDVTIPWTRIIEHKHFEFGTQPNTIITKEFPTEIGEPYYPINDDENNKKYRQYKNESNNQSTVFFGGRLAEYKYYDMHQVIAAALNIVKLETQTNI